MASTSARSSRMGSVHLFSVRLPVPYCSPLNSKIVLEGAIPFASASSLSLEPLVVGVYICTSYQPCYAQFLEAFQLVRE